MVRSFSADPVPDVALERILEAARTAPSAGFSQGQSFVVVTDPALRAGVAGIAGEPGFLAKGFDPWLSRAPVHVVCCVSELAYLERYAEPDKAASSGKGWPVPYWYVDGGCALMLLLLAAVDEGLAAGFLGLDAEGYHAIRDLLGIPDEMMPIGLVTIGKPAPGRSSSSLRRGRKPSEVVVRREHW
jgi:nitroreductase